MCLAPVQDKILNNWRFRGKFAVAHPWQTLITLPLRQMTTPWMKSLGWVALVLSTGVKAKNQSRRRNQNHQARTLALGRHLPRRAQSRSQVGPSQHCEAACIVQGTIWKQTDPKTNRKHQKTNSSRSKWWKWGGQWLDDSLTAKSHKRRRHDLYKAFSFGLFVSCLDLFPSDPFLLVRFNGICQVPTSLKRLCWQSSLIYMCT